MITGYSRAIYGTFAKFGLQRADITMIWKPPVITLSFTHKNKKEILQYDTDFFLLEQITNSIYSILSQHENR